MKLFETSVTNLLKLWNCFKYQLVIYSSNEIALNIILFAPEKINKNRNLTVLYNNLTAKKK